ncbi:MAG: hypothetical protein AB1611_18300 [bacterium]
MLSNDQYPFENYTREVIPGGCRQTDPETGESEDFSCVTCNGGQPGACGDYPRAQELLKKAKGAHQEIGFYLEKLEGIAQEEYSGRLSVAYFHDHWEAALGESGGRNLKAVALTLHEVVNNLMNEYKKKCKLECEQAFSQKIQAMGVSIGLNEPISNLRRKILEAERSRKEQK